MVRASLRQAETVGHALPDGSRLRERLATVTALLQRVRDQAERRVLRGETVPTGEKLVSLVELHSAIIQRGKPRGSLEFGHRVVLGEAEGGIIRGARLCPRSR